MWCSKQPGLDLTITWHLTGEGDSSDTKRWE